MFRPSLVLLAFSLFAFWNTARAEQNGTAFYIVAHQDDWQLFMNPSALRDVQAPSTRVVFVYLTAGDGGALDGRLGLPPFWRARESGAKASVEYLVAAKSASDVALEDSVPVLGHMIKRWTLRNTVSYFLRLPDGRPSGRGYPSNGHQSLERLRGGAVTELGAIDGSTTYRSWSDLTDTLRKLIDSERGRSPIVSVNLADPDVDRNKGDHSDHQQTTRIVLDAIGGLPCIRRKFYLTYATGDLAENLGLPDRESNAQTFDALVAGVAAVGHAITHDERYRAWLKREYARVEPGIGVCAQ